MGTAIRAFIAVEFNDEIKEALNKIQTQLKESGADVRWVKATNIHLTLKFLGEISAEKLRAVEEMLPSLVKDFPAFAVDIGGLGGFPALERPRVIWAGIEKNAQVLQRMALAVEEGLSKIGFKKEKKGFSAHLTLGRVRSQKNLNKLVEGLRQYTFSPLSQTIATVTLFKSTLTAEGPIYQPLKKIPLQVRLPPVS